MRDETRWRTRDPTAARGVCLDMLTLLAALAVTTVPVEVLTLGDLGRAASVQVEASIADEVVIRRTTQTPLTQLRLLASGVGYVLEVEQDELRLRRPKSGKPGKLRTDRFPEIASLLAAQTFDFTALPPGQRVVFSNSPTRLQLPLIGTFDELTWMAAHRGIYGLSFTKSGSYDHHGFDPLSFMHGDPNPGVPLSPKVREWMSARLRSLTLPPTHVEFTLKDDPVALMYTELLNARFDKGEQFVFLAKDSTVMGPFAALISGRVQVTKVWRGLDDMFGLTVAEKNGVWVSNYSESGVALISPISWFRTPERWTPERLARISLEESAAVAVTFFDEALVRILTQLNDSKGVSALRSSHDGFVLWNALTPEQRAAARQQGTLRLPVFSSKPLTDAVGRLLFGRRPRTIPGDTADELTIHFGDGVPARSELVIEVSRPLALVVRRKSGRYDLLDDEGLAHDLLTRWRKNPGSDQISPSFKECAEVRPETISLTLELTGVPMTSRITESVPAEGLKMVPYESVDAGLRQRALERAKRWASLGG